MRNILHYRQTFSPKAPFTQDAEHLATMGPQIMEHTVANESVHTARKQHHKGFVCKFARKSAFASCVNWAFCVCRGECACPEWSVFSFPCLFCGLVIVFCEQKKNKTMSAVRVKAT